MEYLPTGLAADEKLQSKAKLQKYCENLLGYKPGFCFYTRYKTCQKQRLMAGFAGIY